MPKPATTLLFLLTTLLAQAQSFPDTLILNIQDTIVCKLGMINTQNVFLVEGVPNKRGKLIARDKILPIAQVKEIRVHSDANIANKHYVKLLDKFDKQFFEAGCEVLSLEYDPIQQEAIAETRTPIINVVGAPTAWIGVTTINSQKFLTLTKYDYGQSFIHVLKGAKVIFHLRNGESMSFTADKSYSSINNTRLVVGDKDFFESKVIEDSKSSTLKLALPIQSEQLQELSETHILSVTIETAISKLEIIVDEDLIPGSSKGCLCGLFMK